MSIYLDQAAAAYPDREVLDFYRAELEHSGANQEAAHRLGYELRRRLDAAARELSQALADRDDCTVSWGTSGTEIFNLLADSPAVAGKRVLTSRLEHPALLAALRRSAAEVKFAPCGKDGRLQMPEDSGAELAAFHQVQSELGVRQELRPLPGVPLFVDAIWRQFPDISSALPAARRCWRIRGSRGRESWRSSPTVTATSNTAAAARSRRCC